MSLQILRHHPRGTLHLLYRLYRHVFPLVHVHLHRWKEKANRIPDPELRRQALASISHKTFHCEGGAAFAAAAMLHKDRLVPLIVAFQTISDYLDNLCDRSTSMDPVDFKQLHQSMLDAITPDADLKPYYQYHGQQQDGGYLNELVRTCQKIVSTLPGYPMIYPQIYRLVSLYCDLQVHKHVLPEERVQRLTDWFKPFSDKYPQIYWNEFAAAAGSTLGVFNLFRLACFSGFDEAWVEREVQVYFPWISGLHILLDYLVDLEEDRMGGDLNFISYYETLDQVAERIQFMLGKAKKQAMGVQGGKFHLMIIDGLVALYLADGKVKNQPDVKKIARQLLRKSTLRTRFFFFNSRGYRGCNQTNQEPRSF